MKTRLFLSVAAVVFSAGMAHAGPITYSISAILSGSLGGTSFNNTPATLTMNADTSGVTGGAGFFTINGTVLLNVSGIGSGTFTDVMEVFDNQSYPAVGFADVTVGPSVLDVIDSAFTTYALTTAIGPITNTPYVNFGESFPTTAGAFIITDSSNATFTAITPEPMSFGLLGLGLAAIAGGARLRRQRSR